jgi:hypothetical protein
MNMQTQTIAASALAIRSAPHAGAGEDLSNTMAAELTGTVGYSDVDLIGEGSMLPDDLADEIEDYDDQRAREDAHLMVDLEPSQPSVQTSDALQQERTRLAEQSSALEAQRQQTVLIQQQQLAVQRVQQEAQRWADLEAQIPAFEVDPEGHVAGKFRLQELRQQEAAQAERHRQDFARQAQQVAQESQQIAQVMAGVEQEFVDAHLNGDSAAYQSAYEHVHAHASADLRARYPSLDEAGLQVMQMVASVQFIKQCAQMGIDPAEHIYGRAKELGWRSANARIPHSAQRKDHSLTQLAEMSDRQFDKAMAPPGQPKSKGITLDQLGQMSNEEFDAFFDGMRGGNELGFGR